MPRARETALAFLCLSPLIQKFCAGYNSHTVGDNLIVYGRHIYQVK